MDNRTSSDQVDAVVVGAGFAGMYMLYRLRQDGFSVCVFERGSDVGGTWYWNRYPGARCDVESMEYSFKFSEELQQDWEWTERYATQPEILSYAEHVAERFDLRSGISFDTTVTSAVFDDQTLSWSVQTMGPIGVAKEVHAQFLIMATGCLSSTNEPAFDGLDEFQGATYHTGDWPHDRVDFADKTVGVVGTGSSGVQSIPVIAEQCRHLTVFQRTPNFTIPAHNRPLDPTEQAEIKANYHQLREANEAMTSGFGSRYPRNEISSLSVSAEEAETILEQRWADGGLSFLGAFNDLMLSEEANVVAADFVRRKLRSIVRDPTVAELLSPTQVIGCKRLCVDSGYWETFNRENVTLVDISSEPITFTSAGIKVGDVVRELDTVVFATGFDAMTGALTSAGIVGRGTQPLTKTWEAGPVNYLGLGVHGFPNLFMITGPGSPSVLTNMITAIQQHVEWIADAMNHLRQHGLTVIEPQAEAQRQWVAHVNGIADFTLFPSCNSWYLGANVPGKPRVFMPLPGYPDYKAKCNQVASNGYEGFDLE